MKLCTGCGAPIEFAITPNGKKIPLHKLTHTYHIEGDKAVPIVNVYQSHFLQCPKANQFSGRNRE